MSILEISLRPKSPLMPFMLAFRRLSLKAQLAGSSMAAALLIVVLMSSLTLMVLERDLRRSVGDTQRALIDSVAAELDQQIETRRQALTLQGVQLARQPLADPQALAEYFSTRPTFRGMFDALFITDVNGRITFHAPHQAGGVGRSVADRPYFQEALKTGAVVVSQPLRDKTSGEPSVAMAIALRSTDGHVVGVLVGLLALDEDNFLSDLGHARVGHDGYYVLIGKAAPPSHVMHPRRDHLLQAVEPLGPHLQRALAGVEETAEQVDEAGVEALITYRSLHAAPWVLGAVYPTAEAYRSLSERRRQIIGVAAALIAVLGGLLWLAAARMLEPLENLRQTMQRYAHVPGAAVQPLRADSRELAAVAAAFNELVASRRAIEDALRDSEERVRSILTYAPDAFISMGPDGCITEWNHQAEETLGWSRGEALGRNLAELIIPAAQRQAHNQGLAHFKASGSGPVVGARLELAALHKDGREVPIQLSVGALHAGDGYVAIAFLHDISERRAVAHKLEESEKRLRAITANMPALIAYIDREERYRFCNLTYQRWFGIDAQHLLGRTVKEVFGLRFYAVRQPYIEQVLQGEHVEFVLETAMPEGMRHLRHEYIPDRDDAGQVQGFYTLTTDVTLQKQAEAQLTQMARADTLTGLPNRRAFDEKLPEALARSARNGLPLALMFLDVDHFKSINDTLGHAAGDMVLKEFATRLSSSVRGTDTVARLAGDEFVIVLEGLHAPAEAELVARKILDSVAQPMDLSAAGVPEPLQIGTSVGVAFSQPGNTAAELTARADEALYAAKRAGRNTFRTARS